jgi:hypothetical protein
MIKNICSIAIFFLLLATANGLHAQERKHKQALPSKQVQPLKDVKSKEIVAEFPCNDIAMVFVENILRRVSIRVTNEHKVRLVTTVYYQGDPGYTDAEWFRQLRLSISGDPANVVVKSDMPQRPGAKKALPSMPPRPAADTLVANGIAVFDSLGNRVNRKSDVMRNIVLYIPAGASLDIESRYSDISIESNVNELKLRLTNGSCTMMNAHKLTVIGLYGNVYSGNIDQADIDIAYGQWKAKNITALNINSKYSSIELENAAQVKMVSEGDQFEIEDADEIVARKNYGDLRVTSLRRLLDLTGVNADVKVRSIDATVTLVKIDDQYADLRLPVDRLKDYTVNIDCKGCNIYAPFEKPPVSDASFNVTVGSGHATALQLKCNNCTLDFK